MPEQKHQVAIAPRVLSEMREETLAHPGVETGGVWLGMCPAIGVYTIADWIPAGPGSLHNCASFEADVEYQNYELRRRLRVNPHAVVVGSWHSHPGSYGHPSGTDVEAAREMLEEWNLPYPEAVIGIAIAPDRTFSLRTFRMTKEAPKFREVLWQENEKLSTETLDRQTHWLDIAEGREYLNELLNAVSGCGYSVRKSKSDRGVRLLIERDGVETIGHLDFSPGFPFTVPARLMLACDQRMLPSSTKEATQFLCRHLRNTEGGFVKRNRRLLGRFARRLTRACILQGKWMFSRSDACRTD